MKFALKHLHPERFATIPYQIAFLCITLIIIALLMYRPFVEFHPRGKKPFVKPVTQELLDTWGSTPARVHTGMHITDFLKFDTVRNEFIVNGYIWFRYNPQQVDEETISSFAFTKGELLQKSKPMFKQEGALTTALYFMRVQFSSILDFSRFPLDDHRIFLNLINTAAPAQELVYQTAAQDFIISPNIYVSGWQVVEHEARSGYATIELGGSESLQQAKAVFSVGVSKGDIRQLSLILFPLLFLFYLGMFAFSIRDVAVAIALPLASVGGLFAYSFVIQTLAPQVGYMILSDYLFLFFLGATFVIFFVKALMAVPETTLSRSMLKKIEGITIVGLQILLILVWFLLVDVRGV